MVASMQTEAYAEEVRGPWAVRVLMCMQPGRPMGAQSAITMLDLLDTNAGSEGWGRPNADLFDEAQRQ